MPAPALRALFNLLILGVGPFVGNFLWGWLGNVFATKDAAGETVINFNQLFLVPFGFALFGAVILAVFFHPKQAQKEAAEAVPVAAQ